jgi:hypothetical protein
MTNIQIIELPAIQIKGEDFMFQLSEKEIFEFSRSQIVTLNAGRGSNIKYAPFVFTELGVAMLSSVLNSKTAIELNRLIMRAFVALRQIMSNRPLHEEVSELRNEIKQIKVYFNDVLTNQNDINEDTRQQLEIINKMLDEMQTVKCLNDKPRRKIGYFTSEQIKNGEDIIE